MRFDCSFHYYRFKLWMFPTSLRLTWDWFLIRVLYMSLKIEGRFSTWAQPVEIRHKNYRSPHLKAVASKKTGFAPFQRHTKSQGWKERTLKVTCKDPSSHLYPTTAPSLSQHTPTWPFDVFLKLPKQCRCYLVSNTGCQGAHQPFFKSLMWHVNKK